MSYFSHSWLPYIYQYGLGGVIFLVGLYLTIHAGSFSPGRDPRHRKWLGVLIFGYIWYAVLHAALTLAALGHVVLAMVGGGLIIFLSLVAMMIWFRMTGREA